MTSANDSCFSIADESRGVYREKASKFIGIALPVASEVEIKENLERIRKEYFDARHHCYAYRLGFKKEVYRTNDDGEPSGTAGKPIYGQILSKDLSDVLIVVVRYFGGTKLGVPGLINAYRTAAKEALEGAKTIEKLVILNFNITFEFPVMNEVMRILKEEQAQIFNQSFEEGCNLDFGIRLSKADQIRRRLGMLKHVSVHSPEYPKSGINT